MRIAVAVLSSALLCPAQAVPCHAQSDNLTYDNNSSMGGPGLLLAMKATAPSSYTATRIEVFTGEQQGVNTIALWSHDAVNNRPLAPLASGSWSMSRTNTWQGANLAAPFAVTQGQDFWVVWAPISGAQSSLQGGAGTVVYRGSFDGGATWNGPFTGPWKFRIWCGPLGSYESFGLGCPGTGNRRPEIGWFGLPQVGTSFSLQLERGVPGSAALLSFGDSDSTFSGNPLPLSLQPLGAPGCSVLCSALATFFTPTDPVTGQAVIPINVPAAPPLIGLRFFNQWFVLDAVNALGLTTSSGGRGAVGA